MSELLPCPFCGRKSPSIHSTGTGTAWVTCDGCLSQTGGFQEADMPEHILRDHAAKEWNRRASMPSSQHFLKARRIIRSLLECDPFDAEARAEEFLKETEEYDDD